MMAWQNLHVRGPSSRYACMVQFRVITIGVREERIYRLHGKPVRISKGILDHGSMLVIEDEEQEDMNGE
jgi:hypothetical protein